MAGSAGREPYSMRNDESGVWRRGGRLVRYVTALLEYRKGSEWESGYLTVWVCQKESVLEYWTESERHSEWASGYRKVWV